MEGLKYNDEYLRCKKCVVKDEMGRVMAHEGAQVGTILSTVTISIKQAGPYIPIAKMIRCCRCGWVERVYLLPGNKDIATGKIGPSNAEQAGISLRHIAECVRQAPLSSYTMDELKIGKVRGFDVKPVTYNPDAFIEPQEPEAVF